MITVTRLVNYPKIHLTDLESVASQQQLTK
jgi:hypothetical protein